MNSEYIFICYKCNSGQLVTKYYKFDNSKFNQQILSMNNYKNIQIKNCFLIITLFLSLLSSAKPQTQFSTTDSLPISLTKNLVAFYPFSGDVKNHISKSEVIYENKISYTEDRFGKKNSAAKFTKTELSYIFDANHKDLTSFTLSTWFNSNIIEAGDFKSGLEKFIAGVAPSSWKFGPAFTHHLKVDDNSKFGSVMWTQNTSWQSIYTNSQIIRPNMWYHAVTTFDHNTGAQTLYINGKLIESRKAVIDLTNQEGFYIGASRQSLDGNLTSFFDGIIDDVMLYDIALNSDEVRNLFQPVDDVIISRSINNENPKSKKVDSFKKFEIENYLHSIFKNSGKLFYNDVRNNQNEIVGYNVYGAVVYSGKGGEDYGEVVENIFFISSNGNFIKKGEFMHKKISNISIYVEPEVSIQYQYTNGYSTLDYLPQKYSFYNEDIKSENSKYLFSLDNTLISNFDQKIDFEIIYDERYHLQKEIKYLTFKISNSLDNQMGLIDINGKIIFDPQFESIEFIKRDSNNHYFKVTVVDPLVEISSGRFKYGLVKSNGKFILGAVFDELNFQNSERNKYFNVKYKGYIGLLDLDFKFFIEPKYIQLIILNDDFAIVEVPNKFYNRFNNHSDKYWTFLNIKTKILSEIKINDIKKDGLNYYPEFPIEVKSKWGFANKYGKIIVNPKYSFVSNFCEGIAFVQYETKITNSRFPIKNYALINKNGTQIASINNELGNDIQVVQNFSEGLMGFKSRSRSLYGYINSKGQLAINPFFDNISEFRNGKALVMKYGTNYYINKSGNRMADSTF